jgi:DNA-binding LytR/AlgR family response regulator
LTPLKIGIVEDELIVAKSISALLKQLGYTPLRPVRSYEAAIKMLRTESPDLLLVDIILESQPDGIELADTINKEFGIPFIFLTANSDPATVNRAKAVKPYAYLVKPFYQKELYSSIEIAFNNYNLVTTTRQKGGNGPLSKVLDYIFIKEGDIFQRVLLDQILYVESEHVYLNIYTAQKQFVLRGKLEEFINNYGNNIFLRIHRSYAVNEKHLEAVNSLSVKVGGKEIPLHRLYRQELLQRINAIR